MSTTEEKDDDKSEDGGEPTEEVGPEECDADPSRCEVAPGEGEAGPEDSFDIMDELHEAFNPEPYKAMIDPTDGLARPVDPLGGTPYAPPFTRRHVVCLEDSRKYVEVLEGDRPDWSLPCRPSHDASGAPTERRIFPEKDVVKRFGRAYVQLPEGDVLVRPKRPKCIHYKRQLFNIDGMNPDEEGGKHQFANCTARRSNGGAYMSLNNQAVFACDYRDPPDEASVVKYLDAFDNKRLQEKKHLTLVPMLGFEGEEVRLEDTDHDDD